MSNLERKVVWTGGDTEAPNSLLEYFQLFSDKAAIISKSSALVAYLLYVVLINW